MFPIKRLGLYFIGFYWSRTPPPLDAIIVDLIFCQGDWQLRDFVVAYPSLTCLQIIQIIQQEDGNELTDFNFRPWQRNSYPALGEGFGC